MQPSASWELVNAFETKNRGAVYIYYTPANSGGGYIKVFETEKENVGEEVPTVGWIEWAPRIVSTIEVEEGWQKQGIGSEMWRIAREKAPNLEHDFDQMTYAGWRLAKSVHPDEAAGLEFDKIRGAVVKADEVYQPPADPPPSLIDRIRRFLRITRSHI